MENAKEILRRFRLAAISLSDSGVIEGQVKDIISCFTSEMQDVLLSPVVGVTIPDACLRAVARTKMILHICGEE